MLTDLVLEGRSININSGDAGIELTAMLQEAITENIVPRHISLDTERALQSYDKKKARKAINARYYANHVRPKVLDANHVKQTSHDDEDTRSAKQKANDTYYKKKKDLKAKSQITDAGALKTISKLEEAVKVGKVLADKEKRRTSSQRRRDQARIRESDVLVNDLQKTIDELQGPVANGLINTTGINTYLQQFLKFMSIDQGYGWKLAEELCRIFASMFVWNVNNLAKGVTEMAALKLASITAMCSYQKHLGKGEQGFITGSRTVSRAMSDAYQACRPHFFTDDQDDSRFHRIAVMSLRKFLVEIFKCSKVEDMGISTAEWGLGIRTKYPEFRPTILCYFIDGARVYQGNRGVVNVQVRLIHTTFTSNLVDDYATRKLKEDPNNLNESFGCQSKQVSFLIGSMRAKDDLETNTRLAKEHLQLLQCDIVDGYLKLDELDRTIPIEACVCIDLMALRTLTGMGGSSATAQYPCNWNHLHQRNKGQNRLACKHCRNVLGLVECRHIEMISTTRRQEIMRWSHEEPSMKHYYNPPIGPNFTNKDKKLQFYELSEETPYEGSKSILAIDAKLNAIVDRMYIIPSVLHKCDLTEPNNYKRLKWGLRMRGVVSDIEIERAFLQGVESSMYSADVGGTFLERQRYALMYLSDLSDVIGYSRQIKNDGLLWKMEIIVPEIMHGGGRNIMHLLQKCNQELFNMEPRYQGDALLRKKQELHDIACSWINKEEFSAFLFSSHKEKADPVKIDFNLLDLFFLEGGGMEQYLDTIFRHPTDGTRIHVVRYEMWLEMVRTFRCAMLAINTGCDLKSADVQAEAWEIQYKIDSFIELYIELIGPDKMVGYLIIWSTGCLVPYFIKYGSLKKLNAQAGEAGNWHLRQFISQKSPNGGHCGRCPKPEDTDDPFIVPEGHSGRFKYALSESVAKHMIMATIFKFERLRSEQAESLFDKYRKEGHAVNIQLRRSIEYANAGRYSVFKASRKRAREESGLNAEFDVENLQLRKKLRNDAVQILKDNPEISQYMRILKADPTLSN